MWLAGRLKLKGMTTFSAESSWCKSAIGASVLRSYLRNVLILFNKIR